VITFKPQKLQKISVGISYSKASKNNNEKRLLPLRPFEISFFQ
jgi:hypothetical protein